MRTLLNLFILVGSISYASAGTCAITSSSRSDCGYAGITQSQCVAKGCCWQPAGTSSSTPWCYYSATSSGYVLSALTETTYGYAATLTLNGGGTSGYGSDISKLSLQVIFESDSVFRIRVTDASSTRYEIPQSIISRSTPDEISKPITTLYNFEYTSAPFTFTITRKSDNAVIFSNTDPFVFKDQFIELTTNFDSSAKTYGLGESTRLNQALTAGSTYTFWAADIAAITENVNLYGAYPYYIQVKDGAAYGAMLLNSNGMDVQLRSSSLTFTTIGGIIDLYVFVGPTVENVVQQYTSVIGRPAMMPYWSLGFHNCRYGYTSLSEVQSIVANYAAAQIPLDTQWMDIDYMQNYRDFTVDSTNFVAANVKSFVDTLHTNGQHFIPIVDPGIMVYSGYDAYESGIEKDIFIRDIQGNYYLGQVWPGPTYFPDFLNPNAQAYWTNQIQGFYDMVGNDGIWIDMNEVSNFCNTDGTGQVCANTKSGGCPAAGASQTDCCLVCTEVDSSNAYDFPPYSISNYYGKLGTKTLSMSAYHYSNITVYNAHNIYGLSEQIATNQALTTVRGKRPFVLSRSSFISTGKWSAKWTGDNGATWNDLKSSIISIMDFNLFGVPMVGADICGFLFDTTEELCARWIEVGAFYPFSRDHNTLGAAPQELYLWDSVTTAAQNALGMRYQLLPYYYTLFYYAHSLGGTVIRSLWMNYPGDSTAETIVGQFMIGSGVMISPVLTQGATSVTAYFPANNWYDFSTRKLAFAYPVGATTTITTPLTSVNVHVAGGNILPLQESAMTTTAGRLTPFTLLTALSVSGEASGSLFWDDGEQVELTSYMTSTYTSSNSATGGLIKGVVDYNTYSDASSLSINTIVIMGTSSVMYGTPSSASLNGLALPVSQFSYDSSSFVLTFSDLGIKLNADFSLSWEY